MPLVLVESEAYQPLPAGPLFDRWVLEQPVGLAVGLVVTGAVVGHLLRTRGRLKQGLLVLGFCTLLCGGVLAAGWLVTTTRERVTRESARFVEVFASADAAGVGRMLDERVIFSSGGESLRGRGREWAMGVAAGMRGQISDVAVKPLGAVEDGPDAARTRIWVRAAVADAGIVPSTWELSWRRTGGRDAAWKIVKIECLRLYGEPVRGESSAWVRWADQR